jgi:phosphatidylglycerophosphatase A
MTFADRCRWLLITAGGLGCSPFAPGTVGTLGGVLLAVTIQWAWLQWALPGNVEIAWAVAAGVLIVWGCLQTDFVRRTWQTEDPGFFVLDEVTGYLVTVLVYALLARAPVSPAAHMAAFFAFRAFDVLKIQPARKLEDLPGAFGIMLDDQMAGVYAGLSLWIVLPFLGV